MGEQKDLSVNIDMNEPVRGKPHLDIDRVFHKVENPEKVKQNQSNQSKQ